MRNRAGISVLFMSCVVLMAAAESPAGTYSWTFQEAGQSNGYAAGLAMRTGSTWPVVFGQNPMYGGATSAYSLKPVGWVPGLLGAPVYSNTGIKAEASPGGQAAAVWSSSNYTVEFAESSANGWLQASFARQGGANDAPDLAYSSTNRPVLAFSEVDRMTVMAYSGSTWDRIRIEELWDPTTLQQVDPYARKVSVAVESQNNVCLAYAYNNRVSFAYQDLASGKWFGKSLAQNPTWGTITDLSLGFGLNDEVGLAFRTDDRRLYYGAFDPRTGLWTIDNVASEVYSQRVNLAFDAQGNPAVAYVSQNTVRFATKVGYGWASYALPAPSQYLPSGNSDAAVAFDADNLPVIAYASGSGRMVLAYDPIIVPEPISAMLLLCALVPLIRGRKAV